MKLSDNAALIEAILYLENEPLSIERMGKMTGLSDKEVSDAIEEISDAYYAGNHGLSLISPNLPATPSGTLPASPGSTTGCGASFSFSTGMNCSHRWTFSSASSVSSGMPWLQVTWRKCVK